MTEIWSRFLDNSVSSASLFFKNISFYMNSSHCFSSLDIYCNSRYNNLRLKIRRERILPCKSTACGAPHVWEHFTIKSFVWRQNTAYRRVGLHRLDLWYNNLRLKIRRGRILPCKSTACGAPHVWEHFTIKSFVWRQNTAYRRVGLHWLDLWYNNDI